MSKLREKAKTVIGLWVKNSTSELLINNCDEFIYYDDLVRTKAKASKRRRPKKKAVKKKGDSADAEVSDADAGEANGGDAGDIEEAMSLIVATARDLQSERGTGDKVWGSMIKQTLKRRRPGFSESYYGFRSFGHLLEEAQSRGQLEMELDERSGGYVVHRIYNNSQAEAALARSEV